MAEDAFDYDLLVIGSGPAGQRAAIQGAKLDKKVAIVERKAVLGGCSINLGTIPSKTLREAVLELSGCRSREFLWRVLHGKAEHHDPGSAVSDQPGNS
jgi:pyruvate/2-oxoglutarate dehydrogenase complex dihydrolipoamide dehydrogenase (E3) component